jgi:hypothetical protein
MFPLERAAEKLDFSSASGNPDPVDSVGSRWIPFYIYFWWIRIIRSWVSKGPVWFGIKTDAKHRSHVITRYKVSSICKYFNAQRFFTADSLKKSPSRKKIPEP